MVEKFIACERLRVRTVSSDGDSFVDSPTFRWEVNRFDMKFSML